VLEELLSKLPRQYQDPNLIVGTENADDAAVYRLNDDQALVATTDFFMPIVDDPFDFGRMAAANALSDVYAMGGRPIMALAIAGVPAEKLAPEIVQQIFAGGHDVCAQAGVPIAGGHTIDIGEPIYGLVALGLVHPDKVQTNANAQVDDLLILGKPLGIGILGAAANKAELDPEGYRQMVETATQLNSVGTTLAQFEGVHAMTDVTGFGLLGHLLEVCRGANLRAVLRHDAIPMLPAAREYAKKGYNTGAANRNWESYGAQVGLPDVLSKAETNLLRDPQTSGGLLVACAAEAADRVLAEFHQAGHSKAAVIGELTDGRPFVDVIVGQ
jgi:selenide,water dikinase